MSYLKLVFLHILVTKQAVTNERKVLVLGWKELFRIFFLPIHLVLMKDSLAFRSKHLSSMCRFLKVANGTFLMLPYRNTWNIIIISKLYSVHLMICKQKKIQTPITKYPQIVVLASQSFCVSCISITLWETVSPVLVKLDCCGHTTRMLSWCPKLA